MYGMQLPYAQSVLTTSYLRGRRKPNTTQPRQRAIRDINIYNQLMHAWSKQACHTHVFLVIRDVTEPAKIYIRQMRISCAKSVGCGCGFVAQSLLVPAVTATDCT